MSSPSPTLLFVTSPLAKPLPVVPGDLLVWYPAQALRSMRYQRGRWVEKDILTRDAAGELGGYLADELILPASEEHVPAARLLLLQAYLRDPARVGWRAQDPGWCPVPARAAAGLRLLR